MAKNSADGGLGGCAVIGQTMIASGLASVLNATTPLFTVVVMAAFGEEALNLRRVAGAAVGLIGVVMLRGQPLENSAGQTMGILLCLGAALSYGFAGLWGRRRLSGIPPLASATCQLVCSSAVMLALAATLEWRHGLPMPGLATWWSLLGAAALSTALAYVVFFRCRGWRARPGTSPPATAGDDVTRALPVPPVRRRLPGREPAATERPGDYSPRPV